MALINFTGFETGDLSGAGECYSYGTGTTTMDTTVVRTGTYSAKIDCTTTQTGYVRLLGINADGMALLSNFSVATAYFTFWFRYSTKPAANSEEIAAVTNDVGSAVMRIRIDSSGYLSLYDITPTLVGTGTTVLSADTWYCIQLKTKKGNTSTGAYELKINGVTELEDATYSMGSANIGSLILGKYTNNNSQSVVYYYDDVSVDDTAYADTTAKVVMIRPDANGSTMSWTGGTGSSDYTTVDERTADHTDYVQSPASGAPNTALFTLQSTTDVGATVSSISAFKGHIVERENASSTSSNVIRVRSGSTNSDSSTRNLSTTLETRERCLSVDPNTGAAWTESAINAVEVGSVENNNVAVRCTQVSGFVLYVPSVVSTAIKDIISMGLLFPR